MPNIPMVKNITHKPLAIRFGGYFNQIIELMWNHGKPKSIKIDQLLSISTGAYANHSKLSLPPWNLVEDGSSRRIRRLTKRGKLFANNSLRIPRVIIKDPINWKWRAKDGTRLIPISDT
jgi:hypothetical protein